MSLRLCVFVCVSIFRERKSKEDTKQREHGYGTCAEHVCWQTCEAETTHRPGSANVCTEKKSILFAICRNIYVHGCVYAEGKKIVESMNVSNDTKHRKIMNT